jgi:Ca2+-transporting ATPase
VACELLASFNAKTETFTGLRRVLFNNKFLNVSMGLSMLILFAVMYVPVLNDLFTTVPLNAAQLGICAGLTAVPIVGSEASKKVFTA